MLFNVKLLGILFAVILGSYLVLLVLALHPDFKEHYEDGAFLCFQNVLMVGVFFVICHGLWASGYETREKECQKQE